jgi:hypothetical protein
MNIYGNNIQKENIKAMYFVSYEIQVTSVWMVRKSTWSCNCK